MKREKIIILLSTIVSIIFLGKAFAWTGGSTGICSDQYGNNFPCSDGPSQESSSDSDSGWSPWRSSDSSSSEGYKEKGPSIWEIRRQERAAASTAANEMGVACFNQRDYDCAISNYEEALRQDSGNEVARMNLRLAKARKANKLAVEYYNQGNWKMAVQYFKEALSFEDHEQYRKNLAEAQRYLDEEQQEEKLAQAKKNINNMLDEVVSEVSDKKTSGAISGLDFMPGNDPLYSQGDKTSAPVDLSFMDMSKTELKDAPVAEKGVKFKEVPVPKPPLGRYVNKEVEEIIMNALDVGRLGDKYAAANLDVSIRDLERYLKDENPHDVNVKQAISYLEGMRARAAMEKSMEEELFAAGDHDADALLEVVAGKKIPEKKVSVFPKNPEPGPPGMNPDDWRSLRTEALLTAFEKGNKDWQKSMDYLEKQIEAEPPNYSCRNALQFLQAYYAYDQFVAEQNKAKDKK
ncbi:MAG: tetratricopeptide repeat protein [Candidatus Omnitrophica bacterium]|nr:tetratricopeptide repeat protein [Candidatus Omnitrophota bacterium]MDD5352049.1 tetratricopeptide repeat protein [Candidatus Omnitrophota bacterium]MDD5549647.1 tetratricopeptide repeat protein [Candidatus Omnitrophota bacterium]